RREPRSWSNGRRRCATASAWRRSCARRTTGYAGSQRQERPTDGGPSCCRPSGDGDRRAEVDVLDGVQERHPVCPWPLEGLAARDQAHAAGPLVDDGGADGLGEVALTRAGATGVDEADAAHVAVRDLPAGEVDGMVGGQVGVDEL